METMLNVTVNGTIHQYPYGTTYRAIAAEFQENYPHQILLVNRDGKLRELQKTVKRDCSLSMSPPPTSRAARPMSAVPFS